MVLTIIVQQSGTVSHPAGKLVQGASTLILAYLLDRHHPFQATAELHHFPWDYLSSGCP